MNSAPAHTGTSPGPLDRFRRWLSATWEGVVIAIAVILDNKVRSILTILGVGVGVMVIVAFGALLSGVRTSLSDAFENAGPDDFQIIRFDFSAVTLGNITDEFSSLLQNRPRITPADLEVVERAPGVSEALYSVGFEATIRAGAQSLNGVPGNGTGASWPVQAPGDFISGRNFTPAEVDARARVIVLSRTLAEDLFGQQDPIGRDVRVNSGFRGSRVELRVIGVYEPEANLFVPALNRGLYIPHTTATRHLRVRGDRSSILVSPEPGTDPREVREAVGAALRLARGLGPRDEDNFAINDSDPLLEIVDELFGVLFLAVVALSSAGLMVGGIGVIGIMLISVTERTREIGIRKALGARRSEILWQFLVEAGLLTGLGGAAGLAMGGGLAAAVAAFTPVPASIPLWSVAVALIGATLTGVVFGLLPALRASRLEPVEALRAE